MILIAVVVPSRVSGVLTNLLAAEVLGASAVLAEGVVSVSH